MSIRSKIVLILALVLAIYPLIDVTTHRLYIMPGFLDKEVSDASADLRFFAALLNQEISHLEHICFDYSTQPETLDYILTPNEKYEDANLTLSHFSTNHLNLIYIVDSAGEVVFGKAYDWATDGPMEIAEFPPDRLDTSSPLFDHANHDHLTKHGNHFHHKHVDYSGSIGGLMMTDKGPLLVASWPVPGKKIQGKAAGNIIMGRLLNEEALDRLRALMRLDFQIREIRECDAEDLAGFRAGDSLHFDTSRDDVIQGHMVLGDINNNPALLVRVDFPREIMGLGRKSMKIHTMIMFVSGALVLLVLLYLMQRVVAVPLADLTRHVTGISRNDELLPLNAPKSSDELGILWREFNQMILRLKDDMKERLRVEQQLRNSETRLAAILATAPDGIITLDEKGIVKSANPAACNMFGYDVTEMLGLGMDSLVCDEYVQGVRSSLESFRSEGEERRFSRGREIACLSRDGTVFPVHLRISAMRLGENSLLIGVIRDITDAKELQARVLRTKHLAVMGEMCASVAHEIRNPLAGISGAVQIIVKKLPQTHAHRGVLNGVLAMVDRLATTVGQMLDYSKQWRPDRRTFRVMTLLQDILVDAEDKDGLQEITFSLTDIPENFEIYADPVLLEQVLWNLLQNAAQAMQKGGTIFLGGEMLENGSKITVRDTGCGMSEEVQKNLFQPFFTTKVHGVGLGLAICQRIMENHDGAIEVESQDGQGTTISLIFPPAVSS